ncbi:MAG: hypothetical protein PXY39_14250 [archaeon]|nr:hypothetical protein [archaeon]
MPRSNIAADEKIAYEISDEATRANKTLYAFVNESLDADLKVYKEGGSPSDIYPSWRFAQIMKDVDAIPLPGDLLEKMIKRSFERGDEKEWLLKAWFEEGKKLGEYLRLSAPRISELTIEARALQEMLPVKRIELKTRQDEDNSTSDSKEDSKLLVRAVGAGLSRESTDCAAQLLQGIISAYSLRVRSSRISEGIIELVVE